MKKDIENIAYGKALQKIRKKNNLTQDNVSQLTGLDTKYISQIECGIAKGTISTMLKFCKAYNVTPNDILYEFVENTTANNELKQFNEDISKLSNRDKKVVFTLIKALLENEK